MSTKLYISLFMIALLILPVSASANIGFEMGWNFDDTAKELLGFFFGPDIPDFMVYYSGTNEISPYAILQWLIFPFLSLFVVLFGILTEIKIFRNRPKLNGVLALLMTLTVGPTGFMVIVIRAVFVGFGYWSFLLFAALLFIGVTLWFLARFSIWKGPGENWNEAIKNMKNRIELDEEIERFENIARSSIKNSAERLDANKHLKELYDKRKRDFAS